MKNNLCLMPSPDRLRKTLASDIIGNSDFIHRVFNARESFRIYATKDLSAAVAIHEERNHMIFWGDWHNVELPIEELPSEGVFVSSSPSKAIELLKTHYDVAGEWPSWHFLAPPGFGPGEWDKIGPIKPEEVPSISKYWTLSDCPEREMMERVKQYDSACLRENGIPVSWCGLHFEMEGVGNMGFAHTLDEHRRKGYASLVTKTLVNRLATRGSRATVHVIKDNHGSISLCESMEFKVIGELTWADFKRRE
jgi:ribosomal protein S18 acetylase RimI-like enzyme